MNYKGVIIEESLGRTDVLKNVVIVETKIESVTEEHKSQMSSSSQRSIEGDRGLSKFL
jgi:hypothetical protein